MAGDYETARANMEKLRDWAVQNVTEHTRNEATTRLQLIDRLLFECLGWSREDCVAEETYDGKYADYSLGRPARRLLLEAKKEGVYFELPAGFDKRTCKLQTVLEASTEIDGAIRQALGYAQSRGIPIAATCNGHQIVAFLPSRNDGIPPLDGRAVVFSSLAQMCDNFKDLWNYLSLPGIAAYNIQSKLLGEAAQPPPEKLSQHLARYPGFKNRNMLQTDLKILGDLFIEDLAKSP